MSSAVFVRVVNNYITVNWTIYNSSTHSCCAREMIRHAQIHMVKTRQPAHWLHITWSIYCNIWPSLRQCHYYYSESCASLFVYGWASHHYVHTHLLAEQWGGGGGGVVYTHSSFTVSLEWWQVKTVALHFCDCFTTSVYLESEYTLWVNVQSPDRCDKQFIALMLIACLCYMYARFRTVASCWAQLCFNTQQHCSDSFIASPLKILIVLRQCVGNRTMRDEWGGGDWCYDCKQGCWHHFLAV